MYAIELMASFVVGIFVYFIAPLLSLCAGVQIYLYVRIVFVKSTRVSNVGGHTPSISCEYQTELYRIFVRNYPGVMPYIV